jgi:hypothetical protein
MSFASIFGLMNRIKRINFAGLIPGLALLALLTAPAVAQPPPPAAGNPAPAVAAPTAAQSATTATTPPKPPVDVLPDSVPDEVNPFADPQNEPQPLRPSGAPASLSIDIELEDNDGIRAMAMLLNGPDFVWVTEPFDDWLLAPIGADESAAFVYKNQTIARLSLTLYKGTDLMPDINRGNIIQYLSAVRAADPKSFALLTPFPKGNTDLLEPARFSGFMGQGFKYALENPTVLIYHVWIVDLNHEYQLVIKLASPPALVSRLETQVTYILGRGRARQGLGVEPPKAAASSATGSARPPTAE